MPDRTTRRERRNPDAGLIHLLNRRYHAEWERAERLQHQLRRLRWSPLARVLAGLRWLRHRLRPPVGPPLTEHATPYVPPANLPAAAGRVSIVIPFRDQPELLRNCLWSLRASTYRAFEVVLVDNGSTDPRTLRLLDRLRGRRGYRVVSRPEPFNFSRLCNAGAAAAGGEYLLFLNNDTEVFTRDWLEEMLRVAADPAVGAVGATLLYPDRTIQHAGLFPRADGVWVHPYRGLPADHPGDGDELRIARRVPAATAACLMVRRAVFDELKGFDERFPVTHNDVDFCLRLRGRGLAVVVTPEARLLHYESLSRGYGADGG